MAFDPECEGEDSSLRFNMTCRIMHYLTATTIPFVPGVAIHGWMKSSILHRCTSIIYTGKHFYQ